MDSASTRVPWARTLWRLTRPRRIHSAWSPVYYHAGVPGSRRIREGTSAQNVSYVSFATVKPFPVRVFQQVIPEDSLVQATLPFFADSP